MTLEDKKRIERLEDSTQRLTDIVISLANNQILMRQSFEVFTLEVNARFDRIESRLDALPKQLSEIGFKPKPRR